MNNTEQFYVGQEISIKDAIASDEYVSGTVRLIEPDNEIQGLLWLYIRANDESLNTNLLPNSNITYWTLIESTSNRIMIFV